MHPSVMAYVDDMVWKYSLGGPDRKVLEVGSYDENGSVRSLFHPHQYIGMDIREGPGVDMICNANNIHLPSGSYDVVVSTEMLEHDERPWRSIAEMGRVVRKNGWVILTARGYDKNGCFGVHDYPGDYWRFSLGSLFVMMDDAGLEIYDLRPDPECTGVFATGRRCQ